MRLGKETGLLPALSETHTGDAARPEGEKRLVHLKTGARRIDGWVQVRHHTASPEGDTQLGVQYWNGEQN